MTRTKFITLQVREDLKDRLDAYLDRTEGATLTSTIEDALQRYLDEVDPIQEPDPVTEPEYRANEKRMYEVVQAVAIAVKNLAAEYNWTSLPISKRIELLKAETLKQRGVS